MQRINSFLKFAALISILALVAIFSFQKIWDLDIWMHLQTGKYILAHFKIPWADIYSYASSGHFWFNPDWLFAVITYSCYRLMGFAGIEVLKAILFLSIFFILFRTILKNKNWLLSLVLLFFTVLAAKERIVERPEMFSFLFTAVYLYILFKFRNGYTRLIWLLPVLQVFWVNLHAFAIAGMLFVWVFLVAEFIGRRVELPWEWNKDSAIDQAGMRKLFLSGLAVIGATLINPYGFKVFKEYVSLFGWMHTHIDVLAGGITELRPPFIERGIFSFELIYYKILVIISQISFLMNYRRINLSNLFLYFAFLYLSLVAVRNIAFFSIVSMPIVAENFMSAPWKDIKLFGSRIFGLLKQFFIGFIYCGIIIVCIYFSRVSLNSRFVMHGEVVRRAGIGEAPMHPKEAVNFIIANGIKGNGFNNFGFGGYLIWRAWPEFKVFIDGRTSVYDEDHLRYYAEIFLYPYMFEQLLKDFNINYFILDINSSPVLLKRLYDDKNWRLVFFDANGLVFVKNSPENKAIVDKYAIDFNNWQDPEPEFNTQGLKDRKTIYPLSYFKKGVFFDTIGNTELARVEYKRAVSANPYLGEIYNNIGVTYQRQEKFDEAMPYYEKAISINSRLSSAHANLGFL
ncbi:MAG: tetratricopeptide repeat protein, partial [Candidatus Omnitrophica bacterium]|nr:tetratricopeptide repeat protein [Candidatus Omnitrophota bacterium]